MSVAHVHIPIEHARQPASGPAALAEYARRPRILRSTSACALARRFSRLKEAEKRLRTLIALGAPNSPRLQRAEQRVALLAARYARASRRSPIETWLKLRILQDAADGKSYKSTAAALNLHIQEVEQIAVVLFREFGAENKTHLVAIALRRQMIS
jgi:DNA-binding NarL/FixJ family response regulator